MADAKTLSKPKKIILLKTAGDYCLAILLLFGLLASLIMLSPQVRHFACAMAEQIYGKEFPKFQEYMQMLLKLALLCSGIMIALFFLFFTPYGRKIINKTETKDKKKSTNVFSLSLIKQYFLSEGFFSLFAFLLGSVVVLISFFRAANTCLTYDEAATYLRYCLPGFFSSFKSLPVLNNHIFNSICIQITMFFSQATYNELLIRFPNLVFYGIYIVFSYLISKQFKNRFFIFVLFLSNYYLNEFFGLARGYGIACACITGAFYYFDKWRYAYTNKNNDSVSFNIFLLFCSLAALSNSITLYIILCFLLLINFKYKKDIMRFSYLPLYIICLLTAIFTFIISGPGFPIYSTHNLYNFIISVPNMFSGLNILSILIALSFFMCFFYLMAKTKAKNDYCWILIIFFIICLVSQFILKRGYPNTRVMLPFYPLFVIIIANALEYIPEKKIIKPILVTGIIILCFQFFIKIDTKSTKDWKNNYSIKNTVYSYAIQNNVIDDKEKFLSYIKEFKHPVYDFYAQKFLMEYEGE